MELHRMVTSLSSYIFFQPQAHTETDFALHRFRFVYLKTIPFLWQHEALGHERTTC